MTAHDGKSIDLQAMEADQQEAALAKTNGKNAEREDDSASPDVSKWLEREWLRRWVKMDPALGSDDLRPYAFVSRDKRLLASGGEVGGIDALVTKLSSSGMALRVLEPEVKALPPTDAEV